MALAENITSSKNKTSDNKKYYLVINGKELNNQISLNSSSFIYGTLIIDGKNAFLGNTLENDNFNHAAIINLNSMMKKIDGKKVKLNEYWNEIIKSISLYCNDKKNLSKSDLLNNDENKEVIYKL